MIYKSYEIEEDVLRYYNQLLGSSTTLLPVIDISSMRIGPGLTIQQQQTMCQEVTLQEIQDALFGIDGNNTPSTDRFSTYLYNKAQKIVKFYVQDIVREIFTNHKP